MHRPAVAAATPWIGTASASASAIRRRESLDGMVGNSNTAVQCRGRRKLYTVAYNGRGGVLILSSRREGSRGTLSVPRRISKIAKRAQRKESRVAAANRTGGYP